ncbi:MAG: hypothetical protein QXL15_04485 [Candidatus Korarchaeota archaeon]
MKTGEHKNLFVYLMRKRLEEDLPKVVNALYYIHGLTIFAKDGETIGRYGLQAERSVDAFKELYALGIERAYILTLDETGKLLLVYRSLGDKGYIVVVSRKLNPIEVYDDVELLAKRLEKKL